MTTETTKEQNALGYLRQVCLDHIATLPPSSRMLVDRECGACLNILSTFLDKAEAESKRGNQHAE